ncbi:MAG: D-2-hydroxyacid dehydrogenase [Pseudomonadota bacterium]
MPNLPRILLHNSNTSDMAEWLKVAFPDADFRECNSYEALPALLGSFYPEVVYSVRFAGTPGFPRDALFGAKGPRWIANGGAGTDHFGQWDPEEITVTNAAGVAAGMMAEYIIGGFLHFTLDVSGLQRDKAARVWNPRNMTPLAGKSLLIIGLGHTGRALARRAKAFDMTVLGTRARPQEMEDVDKVYAADALHDALPSADFVAVSTPLTSETRGLIGPAEIARLKPGVILADVSRGGVVDQTALAQALRSGHIAGAALDVFETEPLPDDNPLWTLGNVLVSPHCSSVYAEWEEASFQLFLDNLGRWCRGEPLVNLVDPFRGY